MLTFLRTNSRHSDFVGLVNLLDSYLAEVDGDDTAFYSQHNKIDGLNHCIVAYKNLIPVGCGALKEIDGSVFDASVMEIKRMFTAEQARGKGVATQVIEQLEIWAGELGSERCILETGKRQPNAIALYLKSGYQIIENYEPYVGVDNSVCFEKRL